MTVSPPQNTRTVLSTVNVSFRYQVGSSIRERAVSHCVLPIASLSGSSCLFFPYDITRARNSSDTTPFPRQLVLTGTSMSIRQAKTGPKACAS